MKEKEGRLFLKKEMRRRIIRDYAAPYLLWKRKKEGFFWRKDGFFWASLTLFVLLLLVLLFWAYFIRNFLGILCFYFHFLRFTR